MGKIFIIIFVSVINVYANRYGETFIATTYNIPGNYENPAQIVDVENFKISIEHNTYKNIDNLYNFNTGIYKSFGNFCMGILYNNISAKLEYGENSFNNFNNYTFSFYGNTLIGDNLSAGILFSLPLIKTYNYNFNSLDISCGVIYSFEWINTGILLKNIYTSNKYNENQREIIAGTSLFLPIPDIEIRLFSDIGYKEKIYLGVGVETQFAVYQDVVLILSTGYKNNFGFGFGIRYNFFQIDYGIDLVQAIGSKSSISANFNF